MVLTVELNNIVTVSPSKKMKTLYISIEGRPYVYDIPHSKKAEIDSSSASVCPFFLFPHKYAGAHKHCLFVESSE